MLFHYCFTVNVLIEVENSKILIGKNTFAKGGEMFYEISSFLPVKKFFPKKFLPIMCVENVQTIKYQPITFR